MGPGHGSGGGGCGRGGRADPAGRSGRGVGRADDLGPQQEPLAPSWPDRRLAQPVGRPLFRAVAPRGSDRLARILLVDGGGRIARVPDAGGQERMMFWNMYMFGDMHVFRGT